MDLLRHRRATQEELNEGMRQMREAQDRFSRERTEEAIEDQQNPANQGQEIFEEPQSPKNESPRVEETAIEDQKVPAVEDVSKEAVEESLKGSVQKSPNPAVAPTTPAVRSGASGKGKGSESQEVLQTPQAVPNGGAGNEGDAQADRSGRADLGPALTRSQPRSQPMFTPLFSEQQLRQFEELHNRAPWIYGTDLGTSRPNWLEMEDRRLLALQEERDRLRLESEAIRFRQEEERQNLLLRLKVLEEENRLLKSGNDRSSIYGTPEGSRKDRKEAADPRKPEAPKEAADPRKFEASKEAVDPRKPEALKEAADPRRFEALKEAADPRRFEASKEAVDPQSFHEAQRPPDSKEAEDPQRQCGNSKSAEDAGEPEIRMMMKGMMKLMEGMQVLQSQIVDAKKSKDMEIVKGAIPDLPRLSEWKAETAPLDLTDWLLTIEPAMGEIFLTPLNNGGNRCCNPPEVGTFSTKRRPPWRR